MKINIGKNINLHVGTVFDYIKEYGKLSFAEKSTKKIRTNIRHPRNA